MQKAEYEARIAALKSQYPYLFAGQNLGHHIARGWLPIVEELCRHIDGALAEAEKPTVHFTQIKEKFGGLRAYLNIAPLRIDIIVENGSVLSGHFDKTPEPEIASRLMPFVRQAEEKSLRTCAACGAPGRLRTDRDWLLTLCDEHAAADPDALNAVFEGAP